MTFYYRRPTVTEAFSSVQYIMTEVNFGWICSSMVSKYDGSNDDSTRISCLSHWWV